MPLPSATRQLKRGFLARQFQEQHQCPAAPGGDWLGLMPNPRLRASPARA